MVYRFTFDLTEEDPGQWTAVVQELSGCYGVGGSSQEALSDLIVNLQDYVQVMTDAGKSLPESMMVTEPQVVSKDTVLLPVCA